MCVRQLLKLVATLVDADVTHFLTCTFVVVGINLLDINFGHISHSFTSINFTNISASKFYAFA